MKEVIVTQLGIELTIHSRSNGVVGAVNEEN